MAALIAETTGASAERIRATCYACLLSSRSITAMHSLDILTTRHSTPSRLLNAPAPDAAQLQALLEAAVRVPDHGQLVPFRLLLLRDAPRIAFGERIAEIHQRSDPAAPEKALQKDRDRFNQAPLVIVVIARLTAGHKVPEQEQLLSAGCVAYNILLGAHALGFGAQWLTGWAAYDADVATLLGLPVNEKAIGFVHIGTAQETAADRARPTLASICGEWNPAINPHAN